MANRKYRSLEEWQSVIDEQSQSGLGVAGFCKQHDLTPKYFYRKRQQLRDRKALVLTGESFVRVSPETLSRMSPEATLQLHHRDCRLQLPTTTEPAWLARLLQSL